MVEALKELIDFTNAKEPSIGYSPETMYLIENGFKGKSCVLKYSNRIEVYKEGKIYEWLKGKMPVPEVYFNECIDGIYYLVVEMIEGEMLAQTFKRWTKKQTIEFYANLLKSIHSLDITDFPFNHDLDYRLNKIVVSEAKTQYFERELKGKEPQDMYNYLVENKNFEKDLVVCHGDVCFPNFMMKDNELAALIDVSGAGISDRYVDLSIALRTLRYNFEVINDTLTNEDIQYFCECYGLEKLDEFKLKYYIYLDELTNG